MNHAEAGGRTVDEAVDRALAELGASREDVDVEVLDPGARGMFGLGAREARVRLTLRESVGVVAQQFATRLLREMGYPGAVRVHEAGETVSVAVSGTNAGALIGRRGSTLAAIQLLLGLMVTRRSGTRIRVVVDVEGYRERREQALAELARRTADRAAREQQKIMLEPMDAADRRVVHTTLAADPRVYTQSCGDGAARRVVVAPRGEGEPPAASDDRGDTDAGG